MKHKAFTVVEAIVVIVILAILAAILFPVFARQRETPHRGSCPSNLKQIALGFAQYTQDYDEKFPPTKNALGGWGEIIQPYVKSTQIFQCPTDENREDETSDYFFNSRLAGVAIGKLPSPQFTISMGDGLPDQPFDTNLTQLPNAWRKDESSPAHRHLDRANYAFADGHVKWYKPQNITLDKPSAGQPTFLLGGGTP